jgi:Tfp pilus assembly protein PilN
MIKVNLLNSVTDRMSGGVIAVEKKVINPKTQSYMIMAAVAFMMFVVMGFDYVSANSNKTKAETELAEQERIAQQMQAIIKEQNELDKKTKEVTARINVIQSLRATQKGPVAVLSEINGRIPQIPNFRLDTIEQKDGKLVVIGDSPNEMAVTQFGRSLEFSSGLFSNVSIELQRKTLEGAIDHSPENANQPAAPKAETVSFTIKCNYTPPAPAGQPAATVAPVSPAVAAPAAVPTAK